MDVYRADFFIFFAGLAAAENASIAASIK